jgi:hypothetical protein
LQNRRFGSPYFFFFLETKTHFFYFKSIAIVFFVSQSINQKKKITTQKNHKKTPKMPQKPSKKHQKASIFAHLPDKPVHRHRRLCQKVRIAGHCRFDATATASVTATATATHFGHFGKLERIETRNNRVGREPGSGNGGGSGSGQLVAIAVSISHTRRLTHKLIGKWVKLRVNS